MIFEKIIFNLLAFTLFTIIFMKMVKKNDATYVYVLALGFIGIVIDFVEIIFNLKMNIFFKFIMYGLSVVIPLLILIIEKQKKSRFSRAISNFYGKDIYVI